MLAVTYEIPQWTLIVFVVLFIILALHTIFGDLLGKIIYNHWMKKEKEKQHEQLMDKKDDVKDEENHD